jgi:predicted transposase/invertase (TIGR01784 family)
MADTKKSINPTISLPRTAKPKIIADDLGVYINLLTDFGFKRIFGTESNKNLLVAFLNNVLKIKGGIKDLQFVNPEGKGRVKTDRSTIFDLRCVTGKGEHIIVEVQNKSHKNFKERGLHYACRAIQEQGKKGRKWNYQLCPVYLVNIVGFRLDKTVKSTEKYLSYIQLIDRDTHQLFCDKMNLVYIELPRFQKNEDELENNVERWVYILKNLHRLNNLPETFRNQFFQKLFKEAKIANMTPKEYNAYNESLKNYRNMNIVLDEYKETIAANRKTIEAMKKREAEQKNALAEKDNVLAEKDNALAEQTRIIAEYQRKYGVLTSMN